MHRFRDKWIDFTPTFATVINLEMAERLKYELKLINESFQGVFVVSELQKM